MNNFCVEFLSNFLGAIHIKRSFICSVAALFRKLYLQNGVKFFPIVEFIETILPSCDPDFTFEIVSDNELPGVYAETIPAQNTIRVRESVYLKACRQDGFCHQVLAHELWHYIAHSDATVSYAYADENTHIPIPMIQRSRLIHLLQSCWLRLWKCDTYLMQKFANNMV